MKKEKGVVLLVLSLVLMLTILSAIYAESFNLPPPPASPTSTGNTTNSNTTTTTTTTPTIPSDQRVIRNYSRPDDVDVNDESEKKPFNLLAIGLSLGAALIIIILVISFIIYRKNKSELKSKSL